MVIAIIAILACLLLPALNNAREKAKNISCKNNLKTLGTILNFYCDTWDDFLPVYYHWENPPGGSHYNWAIGYKILMVRRTSEAKTVAQSTMPFSVHCPSAPANYTYYDNLHYGLNTYLARDKSSSAWLTPQFKRSSVKRPTEAVAHGDKNGAKPPSTTNAQYEYLANIGFFHGGKNPLAQTASANHVFLDTHVETKTRGELAKINASFGMLKLPQTWRN